MPGYYPSVVESSGEENPEAPPGTDISPSGYAVMAMIRNGVTTGYLMKQRLEQFASFFWSASYGQIYPQLRRLEAARMVVGRDVPSRGRLRREYELTALGEERLRSYLAEPSEPTVWVQNEAILRLMLVDWDDTELLERNLLQLRASTAARLQEMTALSPPRERGQRIQALGMRLLQETLTWCDAVQAELVEVPTRLKRPRRSSRQTGS